MASSKEMQHSSRPMSQHRLSMSTTAGSSLPLRTTHSRNHSHSVSGGSLHPLHRVTRRKSISAAAAANSVAVAAAVRDMGDSALATAIPGSSRRNTMSRGYGSKAAAMATPPSSLPTHRMSLLVGRKADKDESAIDDDPNEEGEDEDQTSFDQARMRRASEGQPLLKGESKRSHSNELRCEKCGKGYKHSSCLIKHRWEHTPEWSFTSKLLISKHQQVQLLEAASVLVAMNQDSTTPPDSAKDFHSDEDSLSPAASGSSDHREGLSSADTTPPPQQEAPTGHSYSSSTFLSRPKRYSSGNSFSRSYQSAPSAQAAYAGSVPNGTGFAHFRQQSSERRPLSSGISPGGQDDEAGLAAAVELLSCSFGTPRTGPVTLPPDVPPVPPLPPQYQSHSLLSGSTLTPSYTVQAGSTSYVREDRHRDTGDVRMEEGDEDMDDEDEFDSRSRDRSDEDDDGVFGRMEE